MGTGTIGRADIYGMPSTVGGRSDPLSIQNPNGASIAPITQTASGAGTGAGNGPALALVGLILTLAMLHVFVSMAKDA